MFVPHITLTPQVLFQNSSFQRPQPDVDTKVYSGNALMFAGSVSTGGRLRLGPGGLTLDVAYRGTAIHSREVASIRDRGLIFTIGYRIEN